MDINNVWIFEIQDGIAGGLIYAASEEKVWEELQKSRSYILTKDTCVIYSLVELQMDCYANSVPKVMDLW